VLLLSCSSTLGAAAFNKKARDVEYDGTLSGGLYVLQVAGAYHVYTLGLR
jgi:hypothetical protein